MDDKPNIDETKSDKVIAFAKGAVGSLVPHVGGLIAEIAATYIQGQRMDRMAEFMRILDRKIEGIDTKLLEKVRTPEFMDLLEDALWQAARALTTERKEKIAAVLKHSLYEGELNHLQEKELLSLLNEINDVQLIILKSKSFGFQSEEMRAFYERHRDVLQAPRLVMGADEGAIDDLALHQAFENDLYRLRLIETRFKAPKKGELPEFDPKTGMMKAQSTRITHLGRLLLRYIDMEQGDEPEMLDT